MDYAWVWLPVLLVVLAILAWMVWFLRKNPAHSLAEAQTSFQSQRPRLQIAFFDAASSSGKPRGLRWKDCQWSDQVEWVRDKQTRQLLALVGVTISFEAIEGGDMEGVEAVGNLRDASAVFAYDGEWRTGGRVIFNLAPPDAVEHFKANYERC